MIKIMWKVKVLDLEVLMMAQPTTPYSSGSRGLPCRITALK
jgi:hypothetical protein